MKNGSFIKKTLSVIMALMVILAPVPVSFAADTDVTVTWNLTNISDPEITAVEADQGLTATLTADSSFVLPQTVSVVGATATSYALENGLLTIPAEQITDNLSITAAALPESYSVAWTLEHITATPAPDTIQTTQGLTSTLEADEGYALPATITVTGAEYSYSQSDGKITIAPYKVSSAVTIEATATEKPCTITWTLSEIAATSTPESVAKGNTVTTTLTANTGHSLPAEVTLEGPATLDSYDKETGELSFTATDFGKEIKVSATATVNKYAVSASAGSESFVTITSENPAPYNSTVTFTVSRTQYVENYEIDTVSAQTSGGSTVDLQTSGNGYSFVMPADSVTISVTWKLIEADFEIQADGAVVPITDGWYAVKEADVIPLDPASKVSASETGPFDRDSLHITEGTTTFYLSDGANAGAVSKTVKLDGTAPVGKAKNNGAEMTHNFENGLSPNSVVTIETDDSVEGKNVSGVDTARYAFVTEEDFLAVVTDGNLSRSLSGAEIDGLNAKIGGGWKAYSSSVDFSSLSTWTRYVLVIQANDKAGNTSYICYGVIYCKEAPKLSIVVQDEGKGIFEKKGDVYHIKDTEAEGDSILLRVDYNGAQNKNYPPSATNIEVVSGDRKLTAGTDFEFGYWQWSESASRFICYVRIHIDSLDEGTYVVKASIRDYFSFFSSNIAESAEIRLSRHTPALEFTYEGFIGYDEGTEYKTTGTPKDTVPAAEAESTLASDKVFYINSEKSTTISFTDADDEIIKSWAVSASKDGAAPVDAATVTGITIDNDEKKVVVDGATANEGKYLLSFAVTGFNECTKIITVTVVVDRTGPVADEITGLGFTLDGDGNPVFGQVVENGVWINEDNVQLTISGIHDDGGLLDECISASEGIIGEKTIQDGVWTGTISKEQNHKYSVTLTDKASNSTTKEFTAKLDTTASKEITVRARKDSTDMALIADQFTFGVFHVDYNKLSVTVEDPQPDNPGVYDDDEKISEISLIEYTFLTNNDADYQELYSYYDADNVKHYYTQAEVKNSPEIQDAVKAKIQGYMTGIQTQPKAGTSGSIWIECVRDANDVPNKVATGLVSSNLQYIAFFRVWDNAGNMSCFFRSVVITDSEPPAISFEIDANAARVEQEDGSVIFTGAVPVTITVTEPYSDTGAFSGINKVNYTVYYGDNEVFTSGSFENLSDYVVAAPGESAASEDDPLPEQGVAKAELVVTLDDLDGKVIDAKNIYIKVDVQDVSGNIATSFTSDTQIGLINIDKADPEVSVDFGGAQLNGRYYGADRTATVTVIDNNFDPETGIIFDMTGTLGEWTASEPDAYGKVTYTAQIVFVNGNHHFSIKEAKDLAGHIITDEDVDYGGNTDHTDFVVDTIEPIAAITFTRVDGKAFGDYNNANVVMTITVSETNFSTNGVNLTVTRNGAAFGVGLGWNSNRDNHSASFTFDPEGAYTVDLTVTDLAGHSDKVDTERFVLDKTAPAIEILGVEDLHAYNDESIIPVIRVTDTNYSDIGVDIDLVGVNGGTGFYDEAGIAGGQEFTFENIEDDDLYTLTVKAVDEAENEFEVSIKFSVNRNGSVFSGGEEISKAMEEGIPYFRTDTLPPVQMVETNVDIIESAKLYLTKDNNNIDLVAGTDYTIVRNDVNGGWSQYVYELNKDLFLEDGVYRVSLVTTDAAGNAKNAESVVAFIVDNTLPVLFVTDLEAGVIYNEETKHVVFTPNDNLVLSKVQVLLNGTEVASWEGEQLDEMLRSGAEFAFDVPESNSRQTVQIILTDAAGNENENQLIENFLVSTNVFVRFYNNKPVFYGSIAGVVVLGGGLWAILARRKKQQNPQSK